MFARSLKFVNYVWLWFRLYLYDGYTTLDIIRYISVSIDTAIWMHYMDANQTAGEETWRQLHKNVESNIEQVLATTPHETPTLRPPASHHENYTGQTSQTRRTLLEKQRRARKWRTTMDPHIWPSKSRTTSPNLHTADMWGHRM